eukprot:m.11752 g.11752  ORF g.11752 m.11752 type:complete len:126 (-) comp8963_c0_seq1:19-396(-)
MVGSGCGGLVGAHGTAPSKISPSLARTGSSNRYTAAWNRYVVPGGWESTIAESCPACAGVTSTTLALMCGVLGITADVNNTCIISTATFSLVWNVTMFALQYGTISTPTRACSQQRTVDNCQKYR